ncbi:MAG: hypothetical protein ABEI39_00585 [Halobacteriales archaeon]
MGLEDLTADVEAAYADLDDSLSVALDRETKHELALLAAATDAEPGDIARRAIHTFFQTSVDTAKLDFHLRNGYDVTYDEFLSGMTYDEMAGGGEAAAPQRDDRRYQF